MLQTSRTTPLETRLPVMAKMPSAERNVVVDASALPRFGLRGAGAAAWLADHGCALPDRINTSIGSSNGDLVLRLGQNDLVVIAPPGGSSDGLAALLRDWETSNDTPKGFDAVRDEGWAFIILSGPDMPAALTHLTSLDTHPAVFKAHDIAQTRALHLDAVIHRSDRFGTFSFDLFFDMASADYVLDVLKNTLPSVTFERLL